MANYIPLATISKDGKPPASRLNDAFAVSAIVEQLIDANDKRSLVDSKVFGLVSGNPPYRESELRKNAQGYRCNVNWRIAESFLNVAIGTYWDMVTEGPTYCSIQTHYGQSTDEREEYSGIITEEFQKLNRDDQDLNYMFRLSQFDMVLYRCGPVMWTDTDSYKAQAINQRYVLVPDRTKSNISDWPICVVRVGYSADKLYGFIRDEKIASRRGWNVKNVRKALMDAVPESMWPNRKRDDWEWYAGQLRNNDIYWSMCTEEIPVAHMFYKEFPKEEELEGRISHCVVLEGKPDIGFLFRNVGRFEQWKHAICPFYYDTGDDTHHSIKGLGIKAYGALEAYNRLQCHLVDAAFFGSALHFQAKTEGATENLGIVTMGPYIWHQPGAEYLPTVQLGTALAGPMEIKQDLLSTVTSNFAQYRQQLNRKKGNPPTATQIEYESANLTEIGKSPLTWYYEQLDSFYEERYRRASNLNLSSAIPGGADCLAFQERCIRRGVPKAALRSIEEVRSTRSVGYGSAAQRLAFMDRTLQLLPTLDEEGRHHAIEDALAAMHGWSNMRRYVSPIETRKQPGDQESQAQDKVVGMRVGIAPMVASSQNAVVFATTYLRSAADAVGSLQQGADPAQVFSFLQIAGPAIRQQLDRIANDPTRKQVYDAMEDQWKQLSQISDKLGQQLQQQAQQQQQQQMRQQQQMMQQNGDMALKARETQFKIQTQEAKTQSALRQKEEKHRQSLALNDSKTAANISLSNAKTSADIALAQRKAAIEESSE